MICLQEQYAPRNACFGCGPANKQGLQLKSFVENDSVIAKWSPEKYHEAFPGVLNGGIIGALLDCHSNWTAAWKIMQERNEEHPPCTVTADYAIKLLRPTPTYGAVELLAKPEWVTDKKAKILAELTYQGKICATCEGTFVAVQPGHPAYHRW